jgi:hypothetical protein
VQVVLEDYHKEVGVQMVTTLYLDQSQVVAEEVVQVNIKLLDLLAVLVVEVLMAQPHQVMVILEALHHLRVIMEVLVQIMREAAEAVQDK